MLHKSMKLGIYVQKLELACEVYLIVTLSAVFCLRFLVLSATALVASLSVLESATEIPPLVVL